MLRESHRPGMEPTTCKSQVQRRTAEPPRNKCSANEYIFIFIHQKTVEKKNNMLFLHFSFCLVTL